MKRNLMVMGLALLLSGCGFQLRGTGAFPLAELDVKARNAFGETLVQVRESLANQGVTLTSQAPYALHLIKEQEQVRAASYNNLSRGAEQQLNLLLTYQIVDQNNLTLVEDQVQAQRFYMHDQNNVIGSNEEAQQLRVEMRRELILQLLTQLRTLTPERLATLQQRADAKAAREKNHAH